jgi:Ca2+/Na+ antiporter
MLTCWFYRDTNILPLFIMLACDFCVVLALLILIGSIILPRNIAITLRFFKRKYAFYILGIFLIQETGIFFSIHYLLKFLSVILILSQSTVVLIIYVVWFMSVQKFCDEQKIPNSDTNSCACPRTLK